MNKKNTLAIAAVLAAGLVLGAAILRGNGTHAEDGHAHGSAQANDGGSRAEAPATPTKGPHGGRLFSQDGLGLELTIFEAGVAPEFRVYLTRDGKPLAPALAEVAVTLQRLGREPELLRFNAEQDYLKGSATVEEPHSFAATITATVAGKRHEFRFEQVEDRAPMSDEQLRHNGITLDTAGPARIVSTLELLGEVKLNQDRAVVLTPRLAGVVEAVRVNAGDRVARGQVLAVLSSPALADQRAELLAAQRRLALARTTYEREKKLWEDKISAEQDYLAARQAMHEAEIATDSARQKLAALGATAGDAQGLTRYEIRSPIAGVVVDRKLSVGEAVKEDAAVMQVADLSSVWVELVVPTPQLPQLSEGMAAQVRATAFDARGDARLTYIGAVVGEQSRSATARLVLPNPRGLWRPGLPVTVALKARDGTDGQAAVTVSADAVQTLRDGPVVFGRYGQQFEARPVQLGRSDGRRVEVLHGLNAGERYAAKNSFLVKAELGKSEASHDH
ncbi:efflux RND transporter periplasmic adaptor subunit [Roseateles sp. DXS20W]|uniref:Efflux RND transporter periplasmic adaptor subunit n=1 Tax=Pelomonas lactea TaxID=3299030 RepID=A0ABW7GSE4_9BURK